MQPLIDCGGFLLESIHAKAGLGRTCDASAAHYPLIWDHRQGIKES